jgi:hypothetical protein
MPAVVARPKATDPREICEFTVIRGSGWAGDVSVSGPSDSEFPADDMRHWQSSSTNPLNDLIGEQTLLAALGTSLTRSGPLSGLNQQFIGRAYPTSGKLENPSIQSLEFELNPIVHVRPLVTRRFRVPVVAVGVGKFSTSKYLRIEGTGE